MVDVANVSRETLEKLNLYCDELLKWNKSINLVSRKLDRDSLYHDHILDCAQIAELIVDKKATIVDFGSGGGLPGIVLCILGYNVVLAELIQKKCAFLRHIINKLGVKGVVHEGDVRKLELKPGYIVSRAVASIDDVVKLTSHLIDSDTVILLHKSVAQSEVEIEALKKEWTFKLQVYPNKYKNEGVILELSNLKAIK